MKILWMNCKQIEDRQKFANMYSDEAKRFGKTVEMCEDWDDVKIEVMKKIVFEKFRQNPLLAKRLLETCFCFPKETAMKIAVIKIIFSCIDYKIFDYTCEYMKCL